MIRRTQAAFAAALLAPLAWAAVTTSPVASVEAQSSRLPACIEGMLGPNCPALFDLTGDGPSADDTPIIPRSSNLRAVSVDITVPTPYDACGPTSRTIQGSAPNAQGVFMTYSRPDKFGRTQIVTLQDLDPNGSPNKFHFEQQFPGVVPFVSGRGDLTLMDMDSDGVKETLKLLGASGAGNPLNLTLQTVLEDADRNGTPDYASLPWAALGAAGHGIINPDNCLPANNPLKNAPQIYVPMMGGKFIFDLDGNGVADSFAPQSVPFTDPNSPSWVLNIVKTGPGDATVFSQPAGISCPPGCRAADGRFSARNTVTLKVTPEGSQVAWSGDPECTPKPGKTNPEIDLTKPTTCSVNILSGGGGGFPSAPVLSALLDEFNVTLSWPRSRAAFNVPGHAPASSYTVKAGNASGVYPFVFPLGDVTTFAGAGSAATWFVVVTAVNSVGETTSNEVTFSLPAAPCKAAPNAPTGLSASVTGGSVTLDWTSPASGCPATSYTVKAGPSSGTYPLIFPLGNTTTVSGNGSGQIFAVVVANNAGGSSPNSNETNFTFALTAPPSLTNRTSPTNGHLTLEQ